MGAEGVMSAGTILLCYGKSSVSYLHFIIG